MDVYECNNVKYYVKRVWKEVFVNGMVLDTNFQVFSGPMRA